MKAALLLIGELERDLDHHLQMEGEEAEIRGRDGWFNMRDRIAAIKDQLQ